MKANELRIGNFIKARCLDDVNYYEPTVVSQIDFDEIGHDSVGMRISCNSNDIKNIKPYEITLEHWLKIGKLNNVLSDLSGFVIFKNGYAYQFIYEDYRYWHEIQNLYYSLTNKELDIDLYKLIK